MFGKNELLSEHSFVYPAKNIYVTEVKDKIKQICKDHDFVYKDVNNLLIVVDEICANIVKHAYKDTEGDMEFEIQVRTKGIYLTIVDHGRSFEWKKFRTPNLNHYVDIGKKGGLGLWIIRKLTDKSDYRTTGRGNEMRIVKYHTKPSVIDSITRVATSAKSVKEKFVLASTIFILLLMGGIYGFFVTQQRDSLKDKFLAYNSELVKSIAESSKNGIIKSNYLSLIKLLKEIKTNNKDIDEIFLINKNGRIIAHNESGNLYAEYEPEGKVLKETVRNGVVNLKYGDRYEVVSSIDYQGRDLGEVHLIINNSGMKHVMSGRRVNLIIVAGIVFSLGAIGIYWLLGFLLKPIQTLRAGVMAIGEGKLDHKIELDGEDEFSQIARAFNDMAVKFKGAQDSLIEQERIQKEIAVAKEIQHTLLPKEFPDTEGFDIASLYRSAKEVGGDYYDIMSVGPHLIGVVVADVSGKGVPGSLVMTITRTVMRLSALRNKSAKSVMVKVNSFVKEDMKKGMFVTAFYLVLDSITRRINFASAGHDALILYRAKEDKVYWVKPKGFPLGISLPDEDLFRKVMMEESVKLQKDDLIAVYTDGITEAMNGKREQYGEKRFVEAIKRYGKLTSKEFIESFDRELKEFTQGYPQNDDITIVIIKEKRTDANMLSKMEKKIKKLKKKRMKIKDIEKKLGVSVKAIKKMKKEKKSVKKAKAEIKFLTFEQKKEIMKIVVQNPEWTPARFAGEMEKKYGGTIKPMLIQKELKRINLDTIEKRKKYASERNK